MTLLDRIEDALAPLRAELTTSCVLCGNPIAGRRTFGRSLNNLCVCKTCIVGLYEQTGGTRR